jgi:NTP pyrophosphatase (non-canonical NTP hydrolase)
MEGAKMLTQDQLDEWVASEEYYSNEEDAFAYRMTPMDMVRQFLKITGQKPDAGLSATLIHEEFEEWYDASNFYKPIHELKELADLVYVIYGYANVMGWDLDEAVRRVHENNMGRCIQPDGTIQRREDGKILKNKDYPAVDLSDLV